MLEKEAKFSTLGADAKVTFEEMPKLLEGRETMLKVVDAAIPSARELVTHFEADHAVRNGSLDLLKGHLTVLSEVITTAVANETFSAVKVQLVELKQKVDEAAKLTSADFEQGMQSKGYTKAQAVMQSLYDWSTALERDVVNFKSGIHALSVAKLADVVQQTEVALRPLQNEESISKWVYLQNEDAKKIGDVITVAIEKVSASASDPAFASVREDLGDLKNLLIDLSKVFPAQVAEAYPPSTDSKSEKALVNETVALTSALGADLHRELTNTLGVQKPAPATPVANAPSKDSQGAGSTSGQVVHHHHHGSGNNMLLWYMLFNNNNGYNSGYSYVPNHTPTYSGATRLRSSAEYSSFSKASEAAHSTVSGGKGGFQSHTSGPLGRSAPSASSSSVGKSGGGVSSSSHSTGSGHVGGFSSGKSSSAGFGG
jgi:hypothetical protein